MDGRSQLLRQLPKMDNLLEQAMEDARFQGQPRNAVGDALRHCLEEARQAILAGRPAETTVERLLEAAYAQLRMQQTPNQRLIINGTGVILHTNLGRALLAPEAVEAAARVAGSYSTLEFDCATGKRGDRYLHVETILKELLGVEAALVVNNNAAAVMLALTAMARGREVVVSRGELVEIGGAFRVPEVMEQSGCILREVGATNKTHPGDYARAIGPDTAALLKVHTSNYRIVGFTEDVPLEPYGVQDEPTVLQGLRAGADVICFSGDKLLGGPQAGILAGKQVWIDQMKHHPLLRALRVDKMTLAALEATLRLYRYPELALARIPFYQMVSQPVEVLEARGNRLLALLAEAPGLAAALVESQAQIGAGSVPNETIPSRAVRLQPAGIQPAWFCHRLLQLERPVAARIHKEGVLLDMRTVADEQIPALAQAVLACMKEETA